MNKQKCLAGLTAMLCSVGALSCFPAISGTVSAAELVSNDFEVNYGGWYGNADAVTLTAEDGIGHNTSRGMSVTGRTSTSDGASAEKGFYLPAEKPIHTACGCTVKPLSVFAFRFPVQIWTLHRKQKPN